MYPHKRPSHLCSTSTDISRSSLCAARQYDRQAISRQSLGKDYNIVKHNSIGDFAAFRSVHPIHRLLSRFIYCCFHCKILSKLLVSGCQVDANSALVQRSPLLTVVASASLPFIVIVYGSILPFFIKIIKRTLDIREEASSLAFEIFTSIRIVVAFAAEERLHARHEVLLQKSKAVFSKAGPMMGAILAPMFFANYATFALTFWFGIKQYIHGHISGVGDITVVLFSVVMAVSSIARIWAPILAISKAASASTEIFATIDARVPDTSGLKDTDVPVQEDIILEDVEFAYPSRPDIQILNGVNCTFESSKVTAIVGPSGSGKSTIVGLIERWYDLTVKYPPKTEKQLKREQKEEKRKGKLALKKAREEEKKREKRAKNEKHEHETEKYEPRDANVEVVTEAKNSGRVLLGNVDLADTDVKWWRSQIGLVQQEPFLFNDTIHQNVAYGLCGTKWYEESEEVKRKLVVAACKEAYADEFINRLPLGYETVVGESGIKLSGGQRQRLAIARSIVKQPSILILDEATSAIDVRTERIVQAALDQVVKNRTTIVIAHRLSTIKKADRIVVLRSGKVVEQGTHEELLKNGEGVYSGLVNAQALSMGTTQEGLPEDAHLDVDMVPAATDRSRAAADADAMPFADGAKSTEGEQKPVGILKAFAIVLKEQSHHTLLYCLLFFGAMAAGAVYPLQAYILAKLINAFTLTGQALVNTGNHWALMCFILALGVAVAYFTTGWASHQTGNVVVHAAYRSEILRNILRKRITFFDAEDHSAGTLTSQLSNDPSQLEQLMGAENLMAFTAVFNITGCIIISFYFGWKLSLVGVLAVLPVILLAGCFRLKLEIEFEKLNAAVFAESSQFGTEAVSAFRTVTSLIMEDVINNRYANLLTTHVSSAAKRAFPSTVIFALSDSIDMLCQALVFWYGGRLLASREYGIISFFVVYMAVVQGSQAAGMWFSFAPNLAEATAAANRVLSLRSKKDEIEESPPKHLDDEDQAVSIEFKDVHFTYKSRQIPVLIGLSLKIKPGQFAALVGASGCGKSTIISLLERFYDPESGSILCSGHDISMLDTRSYRSNISLVAQESTLYEGTIRENVALSVEDDKATDKAIEAACRDAQIYDFIASLPNGYSTRIGPKGL